MPQKICCVLQNFEYHFDLSFAASLAFTMAIVGTKNIYLNGRNILAGSEEGCQMVYFIPKIPIWMYFGENLNGKCWYVYFMYIWNILPTFGIVLPYIELHSTKMLGISETVAPCKKMVIDGGWQEAQGCCPRFLGKKLSHNTR
jgi:hypothetical protein